MVKAPRLPLTLEERQILRASKVRLSTLQILNGTQLCQSCQGNLPLDRCNYFVALAQFQALESVGALMAEKIWRLGYTSNRQLAKANPLRMYQNYGYLIRKKPDPCVEDVFRCAIAQLRYPTLPNEYKQWWAWSKMRGETEIHLPIFA